MDLCVTIKGVSFILQTGLGILGNAVVLLAYASLSSETKLLPVDTILCHLAFANLLLLLTRCVPQTMTVFGLRDLLSDPGCKVVIYAYRVSRALSVCITCMLSVFQMVTIASAGPRLSRLKPALPSLVYPTFAGLWLLNMAVCIAAPFFSTAPRNGTIPAFTLNLGFCHVNFKDHLSYVINGVAVSGRDFAFVALMVGSSGYILFLLHCHSKQVKGIRRSRGGGTETRAAKTVLALVVLYVVFFGIDNVIWIYMLTVSKVSPLVADMRVFFSSCYASLSPYFIISSNKKVTGKIVCSAEREQPLVDTQDSNDK
ncbi:olfactory receptor class A-like protein 1 [Austrofundulus limnaeus]|uniref:Vomeronasal type-1 receptor n=1 Tax=Austrofundulus limnaeus TaxID=52670 RepID=A0A2I4BB85_AUSLI|nr:PREDICTED: vomeronasal type-1 receptor 4-like [Austrofundulus limnaeus]